MLQFAAVGETGKRGKYGLVAVFLMLGSSNPVAIKAALLAGWEPFLLGLSRMALIGLFFLGWTLLAGERPLGVSGSGRRWSMAAALCKGLAVLCFYFALQQIPVNRAVILSTVSPVVNLALVHLLLAHERVRRHHVAGISLTLAGMLTVLIFRGAAASPAWEPAPASLAGDLAMLASIVLHQAMVVLEKKALIAGTNPRQLIVATALVSVAVFALMMPLAGESVGDFPATSEALAVFAYLVTFVGVVLFFYRRWLVSRMDVSFLNSFSHAGRALSVLYAVVLLGEPLPLRSVLGFGLIVAGTAVAAREGNGRGRTEPAS